MALRRWKPFLAAFQHIDAAIEAAAGGLLSRDEFRSARSRIVEMLCECDDATDGGGEKAEGLCALLDEAMAGSLATPRAVPAERIAPRVLASSGDLVGAVGALVRGHGSERVRGLALDVVRGWRAGVRAELASARAAMDVLDGLSAKIPEEEQQPPPKKIAVVSSHRVSTAESNGRAPIVSTSNAKPSANKKAPTTVAPVQPKKPPSVFASVAEEDKKMEATKRKLHKRYQEAEDAKRRRTVQVIKPTRSPPAARAAHGPASCAAERRRFMKPCSLRMRV